MSAAKMAGAIAGMPIPFAGGSIAGAMSSQFPEMVTNEWIKQAFVRYLLSSSLPSLLSYPLSLSYPHMYYRLIKVTEVTSLNA